MSRTAPPLALVGITEIGAALGVSKQRADQLSNGPTFPAPALVTARGRQWSADEVRAWAQAAGRPWKGATRGESTPPERVRTPPATPPPGYSSVIESPPRRDRNG